MHGPSFAETSGSSWEQVVPVVVVCYKTMHYTAIFRHWCTLHTLVDLVPQSYTVLACHGGTIRFLGTVGSRCGSV